MIHHTALDSFRERYHQHIFAIFRVLVGLLFMQHGAQKLFGLFGGSVADLFTRMWVAGIIEFFGGLLVVIGVLTTWVAGIAAVEMLVAFFLGHFSAQNWIPIENRGELALVYFAAFLFIMAHGPGRFSVDGKLCDECAKR